MLCLSINFHIYLFKKENRLIVFNNCTFPKYNIMTNGEAKRFNSVISWIWKV